MRSRLLRQLLPHKHHHCYPLIDTTTRPFTYNTSVVSSRPQLPFLATPSRSNNRIGGARQQQQQQWRHISTAARLKYEVGLVISLTLKIIVCVFAILCVVSVAAFAIHEELREAQHPTPHEWSLYTRHLKRGAEAERRRTDRPWVHWVLIVQMLAKVLARLEDPAIDGSPALKDAEGGAKDIRAMPEPWRRGYVEALLLCAEAAVHTEGYVLDTTRNIAFPPDVVRGPSNPFPKPISRWSVAPPREENCVPATHPQPGAMYAKLLATEGLTNKQRLDATLGYANWLECKGLLEPAAVMYMDALHLAVDEISAPGAPPLVDPTTSVLHDKAPRKPSENLLASLTALATFKARHEDPSAALPILVSILQARRSLPPPTAAMAQPQAFSLDKPHPATTDSALAKARALLAPPAYPPPPPDGTAPPLRDSKALCEEAALHLHIGEILYTLRAAAREDGLAWTREGVDLAEQELHRLLARRGGGRRPRRPGSAANSPADPAAAKTVCRECLAAGLGSWKTMVARMAQRAHEARARGADTSRTSSSSARWLGALWSGRKIEEEEEEEGGRWVAEEKVVDERMRRAQELLVDLQPPKSAFMRSLVMA